MWTWIKKMFPAKINRALQEECFLERALVVTSPRKTYDERRVYTANRQNSRIIPEAIVLHHSDGSYAGGVEWIADPISRVSYHVLIARDGRRTIFGEDTDRCWHAGVSSWNGRKDLNSWSLGVAWEGNTYDRPLEDAAMDSAIEYLAPRMKSWRIPMSMVLTHQQVSPNRKTDISAADAARFKSRLKAALQ